jgi:hypothetical protein
MSRKLVVLLLGIALLTCPCSTEKEISTRNLRENEQNLTQAIWISVIVLLQIVFVDFAS